jgi:hypothetical protein
LVGVKGNSPSLRRRTLASFVVTLEHELTHAIFAWLTFHRVVGFRAGLRSRGHIRCVGRGNWLIAIAPYFFPTSSLIAIVMLAWLPARYLVYSNAALGVTIAYHLSSTWTETHGWQSDLCEVGFLFSALFLPAANGAILGIVLAYAAGLHPLAHLHEVPTASASFYRALRGWKLP